MTRGTGNNGNATNEQLGIALHWEHRSFKEQGIDQEPPIHIGAVANALECKGRLDLPIVSGKHLRRISDQTALQSADNAEKFITALFAPIQAAYKESQSLKGLAKMRYDKEHKEIYHIVTAFKTVFPDKGALFVTAA